MKLKFLIIALLSLFTTIGADAQGQTPAKKETKEQVYTGILPVREADLKVERLLTEEAFKENANTAVVEADKPGLNQFVDVASQYSLWIYPVLVFWFTQITKRMDPGEKVLNILKAISIAIAIGLAFISLGVPAVNILAAGSTLITLVQLWKQIAKRSEGKVIIN